MNTNIIFGSSGGYSNYPTRVTRLMIDRDPELFDFIHRLVDDALFSVAAEMCKKIEDVIQVKDEYIENLIRPALDSVNWVELTKDYINSPFYPREIIGDELIDEELLDIK